MLTSIELSAIDNIKGYCITLLFFLKQIFSVKILYVCALKSSIVYGYHQTLTGKFFDGGINLL